MGYNPGIAQWKSQSPGVIEGMRQGGCGGGPCPLGRVTPATPVYSPTGKLSRTLLFRVFTEVLTEIWLIKMTSTSVITSIPNSFLLPGGQEGRHKSSNPLITLFLWQPALILISILAETQIWWKGGLLWMPKCAPPTDITQEIIRVLEALCQELGTDRGCVSSCITIPQVPLLIDLPLSVLPMITWLTWCLSSVCTMRFTAFLLSILDSLKDIIIWAHAWGMGITLPSRRAKCLHKLSGILLCRRFVCLLHLLIQSVYILLTHEIYLAYALTYDPVLHTVFLFQLFQLWTLEPHSMVDSFVPLT